MAIEIEGKMKVSSHDPIRDALKGVDGALVADIFENNIFFDTPQGTLRSSDQGLRVRLERHTLPDGTINERIRTTYKGPKSGGALKTRKEVELSVSDAEAMTDLYESLGYHVTLRFEKTRQRWKAGGCLIELDTLPQLGTYVEIEGPEAEMVLKLRDQLQLADTPLLTTSYASMLAQHLEDTGAESRSITF